MYSSTAVTLVYQIASSALSMAVLHEGRNVEFDEETPFLDLTLESLAAPSACIKTLEADFKMRDFPQGLWERVQASLPATLTKLRFVAARHLTAFPRLISLANLQRLVLDSCVGLLSLPELSAAQQLYDISLNQCTSLTLLPDLSHNKKLQWLALGRCLALHHLPKLPISLRLLCVNECCAMVDMPDLTKHIEATSLYVMCDDARFAPWKQSGFKACVIELPEEVPHDWSFSWNIEINETIGLVIQHLQREVVTSQEDEPICNDQQGVVASSFPSTWTPDAERMKQVLDVKQTTDQQTSLELLNKLA